MEITDGTGGGFSAKVSKGNRLEVDADVRSRVAELSIDKGDAYYVVSDIIALTTTASFSGILYLKNTSTKSLHIAELRTDGDVIQEWRLIKGPSAGTLISAGTPIVPQNINFQSGNTFEGDVLAGVDAQTVTDGDLVMPWINAIGHSDFPVSGAIVLGPNDTLALECKPAVAGDVSVSILAFFD